MAQGTTRGVPIDTDPLLANDSDLLVPSQKAIKTYTDTGLSGKVNRSGDSMSGSLLLVANPTVPLEAATKDYVDTLINGIDWKQAANAATVAALPTYNVTGSGQILTGTVNGAIPSITTDGVTLTANQRVLVKNETSTLTPNNGIYVVTQVGSGSLPFILTRSSDANTSALLAEATISVRAGSTLANTQWHCNPAAIPVVIGTTNITFAQIGTGLYAFSAPLVDTGNIISIPAATTSVDGYLSSTDWNTFNSKVGGSGTLNYLPKWDSLGTGLVDSQVYDDGAYVRVGIGGGGMGFPYEKLILEAPQDMKFGAYTSVNNFALGGAAYVLGYTNVTTALGYYPGFEFQMSGDVVDDDNFIRYNFLQRNATGTVVANNTGIFNLYADARTSFKTLIGTGTEMVVADASGFISRQPIPIDDTDYEYLMMSSFRNTYNY